MSQALRKLAGAVNKTIKSLIVLRDESKDNKH